MLAHTSLIFGTPSSLTVDCNRKSITVLSQSDVEAVGCWKKLHFQRRDKRWELLHPPVLERDEALVASSVEIVSALGRIAAGAVVYLVEVEALDKVSIVPLHADSLTTQTPSRSKQFLNIDKRSWCAELARLNADARA